MSAMSPGCSGFQPSGDRVLALEAGRRCPRTGEPAEMLGRLFRRLRDDRNIQAAADHLRDLLERHAFFGDGVKRAALRAALEREPKDASRIEPMHGRPAVVPVADIGGDALFAREIDQARHEAVIAVAMNRRRQAGPPLRARRARPARRPPPPSRGERTRSWNGGASSSVATRPGASSATPEVTISGRSEPSSTAPIASMARSVVLAVLREFREVVVEGGVDHAIRLGGAAPEAVQVLERAAMDLGARRGQRLAPPRPSGRGRAPDGRRRSGP